MSMATPLMSDTARAWLASLKGVPPEQLNQHAISAAQTGMISFGDAIALKQMADKLSGAPAQKDAPSPTSVVQDLKQQVQNKDMYSGVGALSTAPAPAASPMESGIASLPAPVMDNAEYAGGGIVAFAEAGSTGASKKNEKRPLTPEEEAEYQRLSQYIKQSIAPRTQTSIWENFGGPLAETSSAPPRDPAVDKVLDRFEPRYKELKNIRDEWEAGTKEREAVAGAEQLSQQAGLGALPAAPNVATEKKAKGISSLDPGLAQYFKQDTTGGGGTPKLGSMRGATTPLQEYVRKLEAEIPNDAARKTAIDASRKESEAAGIGAADKRAEALRKDEMEELKSRKSEDRRMALAEAGFRMAEAASQSGASLLGSAASGASGYIKSVKESQAEQRKAQKELSKAEIEIMRSNEAREAGHIAKADALKTTATARFDKAQGMLMEADFEARKAEYVTNGNILAAQLAQAGKNDVAQEFEYAYMNAIKQNKQADAKKIYDHYIQLVPSVAAAMAANSPFAGLGNNPAGGGGGNNGFKYVGSRPQ